jgi:hypothetical protein
VRRNFEIHVRVSHPFRLKQFCNDRLSNVASAKLDERAHYAANLLPQKVRRRYTKQHEISRQSHFYGIHNYNTRPVIAARLREVKEVVAADK